MHIETDQNPEKNKVADPIAVLNETARRNRIMFSGYQQILHYLATSPDCTPHAVKDIILNVLDQIS